MSPEPTAPSMPTHWDSSVVQVSSLFGVGTVNVPDTEVKLLPSSSSPDQFSESIADIWGLRRGAEGGGDEGQGPGRGGLRHRLGVGVAGRHG